MDQSLLSMQLQEFQYLAVLERAKFRGGNKELEEHQVLECFFLWRLSISKQPGNEG